MDGQELIPVLFVDRKPLRVTALLDDNTFLGTFSLLHYLHGRQRPAGTGPVNTPGEKDSG